MWFQGEVGANPSFTFCPQCFVDKTSLSQKPRAYGEGEKRWMEQNICGKPAELATKHQAVHPRQKKDLHGDIRDSRGW